MAGYCTDLLVGGRWSVTASSAENFFFSFGGVLSHRIHLDLLSQRLDLVPGLFGARSNALPLRHGFILLVRSDGRRLLLVGTRARRLSLELLLSSGLGNPADVPAWPAGGSTPLKRRTAAGIRIGSRVRGRHSASGIAVRIGGRVLAGTAI